MTAAVCGQYISMTAMEHGGVMMMHPMFHDDVIFSNKKEDPYQD